MTHTKALVIAIFADEAGADSAADALKHTGLVDGDALAVLVLDEEGKLKEEKIGKRDAATGMGIGAALALLSPVGLAVGILGGAGAGALHHKGLHLTDDDRARLGRELVNGKAAVVVLVPVTDWRAVSAKLTEFGGVSEQHEVSEEALSAAAPQ
jgi:uncharacterized membrane protein